MLRKLIMTSAFVLLSTLGMAAHAQGGFQGPSAASTTTLTSVAQALEARDDTMVLLRGHIIEHIKSEHYTFRDETGTIRVDIDHKRWAGQTVTPQNLVEIWGEVDRGRHSVEIDVKSLRIIE